MKPKRITKPDRGKEQNTPVVPQATTVTEEDKSKVACDLIEALKQEQRMLVERFRIETYNKHAMREPSELADMAKQGDEEALSLLVSQATWATYELEQIAKTNPDRLKPFARRRTEWPILAGVPDNEEANAESKKLLVSVELGRAGGHLDFDNSNEIRKYLLPIRKLMDNIRYVYTTEGEIRNLPLKFGHSPEVAENLSVQRAFAFASLAPDPLPFANPKVHIEWVAKCCKLPEYSKSTARKWRRLMSKLIEFNIGKTIQSDPRFRRLGIRKAEKAVEEPERAIKVGSASYETIVRNEIYEAFAKLLEFDAPPDAAEGAKLEENPQKIPTP